MATTTIASKRKRPPPPPAPSVADLAEQWLTAKRALESAGQAAKGHSDRARRADLARWGRLLAAPRNGATDEDTALDVTTDLAKVTLSDLDTDQLVTAVATAKKAWSDATVARMLSTMRGFTRWLARRQLLSVDPCDSELLRVSARAQRRPRAVEETDVEAMVAAARAEPTGRQQMFWPARDVALLRFLAGTGARAEEICGATIGEIDRRPERPIWRVGRSKGGKQRDVPLRRDTVDAIDHWLENRTMTLPGRAPGRAAPLFVRTDGTPLTERTLDRLLRAIALRAAVGLPAGAAAHAFRHHYGVTLALRGVPQPAISQLMGHADPRTTAIYTTVAASALIGVLDDAGLL